MKTIVKVLKRIVLLGISFVVIVPLMAQQPVNKSKALKKQTRQERITVSQLKANRAELLSCQSGINNNLAVLEKLAKQKMPANLSRKDRKKWKQHTDWINSVVKRLSEHEKKVKLVLKDTKKGIKKGSSPGVQKASLQQMSNMNMQFLQLQNSMQMESRAYNAVSNALKVRHDAAQSAIRNMK